MVTFQERQDDVEIAGRVVSIYADQALPGEPPSHKWHIFVQLNSGNPRLVTADGGTNLFDWLECRVRPPSPYRAQPHAGRLLGELLGQNVRIRGTWGDVTDDFNLPASTLLWPIASIVVDRGITPIVEEHGFSQAIRDIDVYAFSDDTEIGPFPSHHREDRELVITVPFPGRPQSDSTPVFTECVDREDREQVLYGYRTTPAPAFPIHADGQHTFLVDSQATSDVLEIHVDTGLPSAGKGFYYAKFTLTYDEPFAKMCLPDVCLADPGRSCQWSGEHRLSYVWPKLDTALAGDLLLGPAGGEGVLGRLLGALSPTQFYDHMVMFVEDDGRSVKHCTASDERIAAEEYYTANVTVNTPFFSGSKRLPLLGIRGDILKFAWPGTISQTLAEVSVTGRNRSNGQFSFQACYPEVVASEAGAPPLLRELPPAERDKRTAFHDPEGAGTAKREKNPNKRAWYSLARLQRTPAYRKEIDPDTGQPVGTIRPVFVRPHPFLTATARPALRVMAAEAKKVSAHYRFFAYSDATIAVQPAFNAPVAGWPQEEGVDWAAGTVAAVCSSFVWAAAQAANSILVAAGKPRIELEGEVEAGDQRPSSGTDGIYKYTVDERRAAAKALYGFTHERVEREVNAAIGDLPWYADLILDATGISDSIDATREYLANVVANQLCNIFATDATADLAATWNNPGTGIAVSPDDTMLNWDVRAALTAAPPTDPNKVNVYGNSLQVAIPEPGWGTEPVLLVRESVGKGDVRGTVVARLPGEAELKPVIGATVRLGCETTTTRVGGNDQIGFEFIDVKAGRYLIRASDLVIDRATNVAIEWKSKEVDIRIGDGDFIDGVVLELLPPPGLARSIEVKTHHDIVDRVVVGKDRWGHFDMNGSVLLAFDPKDSPSAPPEQQNTKFSDEWDRTTPEVGSGVHVRVLVTARLRPNPPASSVPFDGAVICDIKIVFFDSGEGETNVVIEQDDIVLEVEKSHTLPYNEASDDTVPERASGTITITNLLAVLP
jgi:hypothetical protein